MSDFIFNIAKGKHIYYASLPALNDALILVPIETSGIVSDATMRDYDDLATLLAGASNEQTTMGRKTLASVTSTVDDTNDWAVASCANPVYTSPTGNPISAFVLCYDPDTTAHSDANCIPLYKWDFVFTPIGNTITVVVNSNGLARAA